MKQRDNEVAQAILRMLSAQPVEVQKTVFKGLVDGMMGQQPGAVRSAPHDGPNKSNTIISELTETPGLPLAQLAMKVYGESSPNSSRKLGSLLITLKKAGRVDNPEHGKWIVTEQELKKQRKAEVDA